jgi:CO/xanthine dehydrogenase FAD-binding subunit
VVEALHPSRLAEAVALRAAHGAIPFAGGTDLMVKLRRGAGALPAFERPVLFLDRCEELRQIGTGSGMVEIGAMLTLHALTESSLVHPCLREAILQMGGPALRTVATIGGNICNASPAGDTLPFLYAFDAVLSLVSPAGERHVGIAEFITGPGKISIRKDELLRCIRIPAWNPAHFFWRKVGTRRANALTKISIAAFADRDSGTIHRARISLGAVAPTVIRLTQLEAMLENGDARSGAGLNGTVDRIVRSSVHPIDDQRSTSEYRQRVAVGLVARFVDLLRAAGD